MSDKIYLDGHFLRFGKNVLNRANVCEANLETGEILMNSGHAYIVSPDALKAWFCDWMDSAKIDYGNART